MSDELNTTHAMAVSGGFLAAMGGALVGLKQIRAFFQSGMMTLADHEDAIAKLRKESGEQLDARIKEEEAKRQRLEDKLSKWINEGLKETNDEIGKINTYLLENK